ncbi:unnamed protein product [Linum tenue]|uniref:Bifunctional inhibitor/plant lipid transfer protein/seed storage helical domain-containing protein n=1 Tax=Linum tenue TaxID=586396 RepID=A0AAV0JYH0_9ROSI|nr:unnamed protein product [Linum tenue]
MASTTAAAMIAAVLLLLATATTVTEAQGGGTNTPSCASKLIPCANYISNTSVTPPASCCDPIKEAVRTELPCLCNLYNTPGLLASFGINVTQALGLTTRCGISADTSSCSKVTTGGAGSPTASAVPSPPAGSNSNNGSRMMAWTGFWSFGLIWVASLLF